MNLDDDVLDAARALAHAERRSLGQVISEVVRRGLAPRAAVISDDHGFPVFSVEPGAPVITLDMVDAALEDT